MAITLTLPFTTAGNYTYDSDIIEITGGVAKLKDQRPSNASFYANYNSDINGSWGDGTLTGTATGGAAIASNQLDLIYSDTRYVDYDADSNADSQQTGCIRLKVTPNYTGSPTANKCFFCITKANGNSTNLITFYHGTSGNITLAILNQNNISIINQSLGSWSPISGTEYEFELDYDLTDGATRLFIDGTQFGSTQTGTGIRSADIALLRVGSYFNASMKSNFKINDLIIFSTVQHTSNYTPSWSSIPATIYDTDNSTVEVNASWRNDGLCSFSETSTKSGSDQIKYILKKDNSWYYWDGSAWSESDETYSQANTAAEIETNKLTFTTVQVISKVKAFLHSDNGTSTPQLDQLDICYDYAGETPDTINTCTVWGYSKDPDNSIDTISINAKLNREVVQYKDNITIVNETISDTPDTTSGYWELELIETANMESGTKYIFSLNGKEYLRSIPDEESKNFWDLT